VVLERLHGEALKENEQFDLLEKELVTEASQAIQSLLYRLGAARERLFRLVNDPLFSSPFDALPKMRSEEEKRDTIRELRKKLSQATLEAEEESALKSPNEILPWAAASKISFFPAIKRLESTEVRRALARADARDGSAWTEQRRTVLELNEAFRMVIGKRWIIDTSGQKRNGFLWEVFEQRKKEDESGLTEKKREQRWAEKAKEAEFLAGAKPLLERGGFMVNVSGKKGVVLLAAEKSQDGLRDIWRVKDVYGATNGVRVGSASPYDMRAFPSWLGEGAARAGLIGERLFTASKKLTPEQRAAREKNKSDRSKKDAANRDKWKGHNPGASKQGHRKDKRR
jgi:hypothetical protein